MVTFCIYTGNTLEFSPLHWDNFYPLSYISPSLKFSFNPLPYGHTFFLFLVTEKSSFYISIMDKKNLVTDYSCVSSSSLWIGSNGSTPWPRSGSGIQNILLLLISIPNLLSTQRCTFQYIQRPGQWKNIYTSLQVSVNPENRYIYIYWYI